MAAFLAKIQPLVLANLQKHLRFAKVELAPPSPARWGNAIGQFQAMVSKNPANLTVGAATQNLMVAAEVCCWFVLGEVIGKSWASGTIPGISGNSTFYGYNTSRIASDGRRIYQNSEGKYVE